MTIEILAQPTITPKHTMHTQEWQSAIKALVPNSTVSIHGIYSELMRCVFDTGAVLLVRWHEHQPQEVVRFADEHDMLNPITREETIARLRVHELVASLPPDVLAEAEQALSGLTISTQDAPSSKEQASNDDEQRRVGCDHLVYYSSRKPH